MIPKKETFSRRQLAHFLNVSIDSRAKHSLSHYLPEPQRLLSSLCMAAAHEANPTILLTPKESIFEATKVTLRNGERLLG